LHLTISSCCLVYCFFFQAEDGIRALIVTGVQTCALPISVARPADTAPQPRWTGPIGLVSSVSSACAAMPLASAALTAEVTIGVRSEERRVGKESRSRWA